MSHSYLFQKCFSPFTFFVGLQQKWTYKRLWNHSYTPLWLSTNATKITPSTLCDCCVAVGKIETLPFLVVAHIFTRRASIYKMRIFLRISTPILWSIAFQEVVTQPLPRLEILMFSKCCFFLIFWSIGGKWLLSPFSFFIRPRSDHSVDLLEFMSRPCRR